MNPNERLQAIRARLTDALKPQYLEILDDSQSHSGHAGAESGAGHFKVIIASEQFTGKSKIAAHQMIYKVLHDLMDKEIHALQIELKAL